MTVLRGRLVTPSHDGPAEVRVEDDRIAAITPIEDAAADDVILPGLVDIHCHGGAGGEFGPDADRSVSSFAIRPARTKIRIPRMTTTTAKATPTMAIRGQPVRSWARATSGANA